MIRLRILICLFLFCILHKCETRLVKKKTSAKQENSKVCLTAPCKNAATTIRESIDPKVAPCDDFYKFACGNFLKTAVIPKDYMSVDRYSPIQHNIVKQLRRDLEEPIQHNEPRFLTLSKNFFKACMNTNATEKNVHQTLLGKFKNIGGWPLLEGDSWKEKKFDWEQATYFMQKEGFIMEFFFTFDIVTDFSNSTKNVLDIDQPVLGLERETFLKGFNDKSVADYYHHMVDTAISYGANKARAEKELRDVLDFEIKLATICLSEEERRNQTVLENLMTVKDLTKRYPSIPWKRYFNTILKSAFVIGDDEIIKVSMPTFFEKLDKLMKETPKRVLANYIISQAIEFQGQGGNMTKDDCLMMTTGILALGTGALYARKYFTPESKKSAEELAVNIEQQFAKILKEVDWMDEKTRTSALDKLKSMKTVVGYPDEVLHDKTVDEYYKTLEITPNDSHQANSNVSIFRLDHSFSNLRKPVDKSDWPWVSCAQSIVTDTHADYDDHLNRISIPAGILQDIFFDKDRPQYLNYAAIGSFILGNKITTAFDNEGSQFDQNGNLKDWWTPETKMKFRQKAACITKQYANYKVKDGGIKLTGTETERKNIADNGGVKMAYLAYQDWVKAHGPEPKLPGLDYSQSQLFWIQAAITQCAKYTPQYLKDFNSNDRRFIDEFAFPSEFRATGVFANRPEFARDFSCPVGSKMNPVEKCSVW